MVGDQCGEAGWARLQRALYCRHCIQQVDRRGITSGQILEKWAEEENVEPAVKHFIVGVV